MKIWLQDNISVLLEWWERFTTFWTTHNCMYPEHRTPVGQIENICLCAMLFMLCGWSFFGVFGYVDWVSLEINRDGTKSQDFWVLNKWCQPLSSPIQFLLLFETLGIHHENLQLGCGFLDPCNNLCLQIPSNMVAATKMSTFLSRWDI
jgi:hypothetical protein